MSSETSPLAGRATRIIVAYLAKNSLPASSLPPLIKAIHKALRETTAVSTRSGRTSEPAVPIAQAITKSAVICLEDGKSFKSMKRHLQVHHQLTPEAYRSRWGLPVNFPMVAPDYARQRATIAKGTRGRRRKKGPMKAAERRVTTAVTLG